MTSICLFLISIIVFMTIEHLRFKRMLLATASQPDEDTGVVLTVQEALVFDRTGKSMPVLLSYSINDKRWCCWYEQWQNDPAVYIVQTSYFDITPRVSPDGVVRQQVYVEDGVHLYLRANGCCAEPSVLDMTVFIMGKDSLLFLLPCMQHQPCHPMLLRFHDPTFIRTCNEQERTRIVDLESQVCRLERDLNSRLALSGKKSFLSFNLADLLFDDVQLPCATRKASICK